MEKTEFIKETIDKWTYERKVYSEDQEINFSDDQVRSVKKGWIPQGGLHLKNIKHSGHKMAKEFSAVTIYVKPGSKVTGTSVSAFSGDLIATI